MSTLFDVLYKETKNRPKTISERNRLIRDASRPVGTRNKFLDVEENSQTPISPIGDDEVIFKAVPVQIQEDFPDENACKREISEGFSGENSRKGVGNELEMGVDSFRFVRENSRNASGIARENCGMENQFARENSWKSDVEGSSRKNNLEENGFVRGNDVDVYRFVRENSRNASGFVRENSSNENLEENRFVRENSWKSDIDENRFSKQNSINGNRFSRENSKNDNRFSRENSRIENRFSRENSRVENSFSRENSRQDVDGLKVQEPSRIRRCISQALQEAKERKLREIEEKLREENAAKMMENLRLDSRKLYEANRILAEKESEDVFLKEDFHKFVIDVNNENCGIAKETKKSSSSTPQLEEEDLPFPEAKSRIAFFETLKK